MNTKIHSATYYQTLFEHSGTAVAVINNDMTLSHVNKKFEQLFGYSKIEAEGIIRTIDFIPEHNRQYVEDIHRLRRDQPEAAPSFYVTPVITKTGEEKIVEVHADILPNTNKSIASMIDVTEENLLKIQVTEKEKLIQSIVEHSVDAIVSINKNNKINIWNNGAERIFGYLRKDIVGKPINTLFSEKKSRKEFNSLWKTLSQKNYVENYETHAITKYGKQILCTMTWTNIIDDQNHVISRSAIVRDITESKAIEGRMVYQERMSALGELSASLAHEIKNPLNSMVINMEVLKGFISQSDSNTKPSLEKYARIITSEIERLDKVIRGFLKFARPVNIQFRSIDIRAVLETVLELLHHEAMKQNISIYTDIAEHPLFIEGDEDQIKQATLNLLLNSLQAMENGGMLSLTAEETANKQIKITIKDTGSGISDEDQNKIFDLYYSTKDKGSGLGLPIVKRIINAHNGHIHLESILNEGTTFILIFPKVPTKETP